MQEVTLRVDNLFSILAASKYYSASRPTLYKMIDKGRLHPLTIGKRQYLLREELDKLFERR